MNAKRGNPKLEHFIDYYNHSEDRFIYYVDDKLLLSETLKSTERNGSPKFKGRIYNSQVDLVNSSFLSSHQIATNGYASEDAQATLLVQSNDFDALTAKHFNKWLKAYQQSNLGMHLSKIISLNSQDLSESKNMQYANVKKNSNKCVKNEIWQQSALHKQRRSKVTRKPFKEITNLNDVSSQLNSETVNFSGADWSRSTGNHKTFCNGAK